MIRRAISINRSYPWRSARTLGTVVAGVGCVLRGVAYLPITEGPDRLPFGLAELAAAVGTIAVYGAAWLLAGLLLLGAAVLGHRWSFAWALAIAIASVWGLAYLLAWFIDGGRAWLNAGSYLTLAGLFMTIALTPPAPIVIVSNADLRATD